MTTDDTPRGLSRSDASSTDASFSLYARRDDLCRHLADTRDAYYAASVDERTRDVGYDVSDPPADLVERIAEILDLKRRVSEHVDSDDTDEGDSDMWNFRLTPDTDVMLSGVTISGGEKSAYTLSGGPDNTVEASGSNERVYIDFEHDYPGAVDIDIDVENDGDIRTVEWEERLTVPPGHRGWVHARVTGDDGGVHEHAGVQWGVDEL